MLHKLFTIIISSSFSFCFFFSMKLEAWCFYNPLLRSLFASSKSCMLVKSNTRVQCKSQSLRLCVYQVFLSRGEVPNICNVGNSTQGFSIRYSTRPELKKKEKSISGVFD